MFKNPTVRPLSALHWPITPLNQTNAEVPFPGLFSSSFLKFTGKYRAAKVAENISSKPPIGFKKGKSSKVVLVFTI